MIGKTNIGNSVKPIYDAITSLEVIPEKKTVGAVVETIKKQLVSRQKAIDAINSTRQISNGTKLSQAGMVSVQVSCRVTNHDNSGEGSIGCAIYKNGSVMASDGDWIGAWSGGSVGCSAAFVVNAGDTVSFSYWGNEENCIFVSGSGSIVYTPNPF